MTVQELIEKLQPLTGRIVCVTNHQNVNIYGTFIGISTNEEIVLTSTLYKDSKIPMLNTHEYIPIQLVLVKNVKLAT